MNRNFLKNVFFSSLLILGFVVVTVSCDEAPKDKQETKEVDDQALSYQKKFNQLMKETIAVHDEVMPKMGEIKSLINKLEGADAEKEEVSEEMIGALKDGHDRMMSWMKKFSSTFDRTETNEGISVTDLEVLEERLNAISESYEDAQEMKNKVNSSIEKATAFLTE